MATKGRLTWTNAEAQEALERYESSVRMLARRLAPVARMGQALDSFILEGVTTTIPFLARVIRHPDFAAGNVDTKFLERNSYLLRPEA